MNPLGHNQTKYLLNLISSKKQDLKAQEIKIFEKIEREFKALPDNNCTKKMKEESIAKQRTIFSNSLRELEEMEANLQNFYPRSIY